MSEWQPIETAPRAEFSTIIGGFLHDEEGYSPPSREMYWGIDRKGWRLTSDPNWNGCPQPTHWQPLPAPPVST